MPRFPTLPTLRLSLAAAWCVLIAAAACGVVRAGAEVAEVAGGGDRAAVPVLSLREAVETALARNLGLSIQRLAAENSREAVPQAEASFDPVLSASFRQNKTRSPQAASSLDGASIPTNEGRNGSVGVDQRLQTGATVTVRASLGESENNSSFSTLNPSYSSETSVMVRQPLLRGFGPGIVRLPLVQARLSAEQGGWQLRRVALDLLRDVEVAYWNAAYAAEVVHVREAAVAVAERLVQENRRRAEVGLAIQLNILEAEAAAAARRDDLVIARRGAADALDRLLVLVGEAPDVLPVVRFEPPPPAELPAGGLDAGRVLGADPARRVLELGRERSANAVRVAEDQLRPDLGLNLAGSYLGRDGAAEDSIGNLFDREAYSWSAGLDLRLPWGWRAERAAVRTARRTLEQEELRIASADQELLADARVAWRSLETGVERVVTAGLAARLASERFTAVKARQEQGLSTVRELLEAQRDDDEARLRELNARLEVARAAAVFARLDGSLPARLGVDPAVLGGGEEMASAGAPASGGGE